MKLHELKKIIDATLEMNEHSKDAEVCIQNNSVSFGGTSTTKVNHATLGFDWDSNKFIIKPQNPMTEEES